MKRFVLFLFVILLMINISIHAQKDWYTYEYNGEIDPDQSSPPWDEYFPFNDVQGFVDNGSYHIIDNSTSQAGAWRIIDSLSSSRYTVEFRVQCIHGSETSGATVFQVMDGIQGIVFRIFLTGMYIFDDQPSPTQILADFENDYQIVRVKKIAGLFKIYLNSQLVYTSAGFSDSRNWITWGSHHYFGTGESLWDYVRWNPTEGFPEEDSDGDGVYDNSDNCPFDYNPLQEDYDLDGLGDICDNCVSRYNPGQEDVNANGIGDACETIFLNTYEYVGGNELNLIADINNDGWDDIIAEYTFINDGNYNFIFLDSFGIGHTFSNSNCGYHLADIDNDGDLDFIICGYSSNPTYVRTYLNDGTGIFIFNESFSFNCAVYWGHVADLNNDGFIDIVINGHGQPHTAKILWNQRNGIFSIQDVSPCCGMSVGVDISDYDNDCDYDVLWANNHYGTPTYIAVNNGIGGLSGGCGFAVGHTEGMPPSTFINLNGDGFQDVLSYGYPWIVSKNKGYGDTTWLYISNANGTYTKQTECFPGLVLCKAPDVDNDGDEDVYPNYVNDGNGNLTILELENWPIWRAFGHLNDDGYLDMVSPDGYIFLNVLSTKSNGRPSVPDGLLAVTTDSSITFTWNQSIDDITGNDLVKYNLRVGTTSNGNEILSGKTPSWWPNTEHNESWTLYLDMTQYCNIYWSVQSQDGSYMRSEWAPEQITKYDPDGDGLGYACDNCPEIFNPNQADTDNDEVGDSCDICTDTDGDGYGNPGFPANTCEVDNCPDSANPDQLNSDGDDFGDVCDICPEHPLDDCCNPTESNSPPEITSTDSDIAAPGEEYVYVASATDPDCDGTELFISYGEDLPSWCDTSGDTLFGYVDCEYVDTAFEVIVFDGELADTLEVTLTIDHSNIAPQIVLPFGDTLYADMQQELRYCLDSIYDPDDEMHEIRYLRIPSWADSAVDNDCVYATIPLDTMCSFDTLTVAVYDLCNADTSSFIVAVYVCGDINGEADCESVDCVLNIFDITYLIAYLYMNGPEPCPEEMFADVNGDGVVNIFDITYTISYLYLEGPPPICPPNSH